MSKKSEAIAKFIQQFAGGELDAHYLGYFNCFNRQLFYEAHDVLEDLWLADRHGPDGNFYKGLIQLAGAFVHVQKNRRGPACALFGLARTNLQKYPARHQHLDLGEVLDLIAQWVAQLENTAGEPSVLLLSNKPALALVEIRGKAAD